MSFSKISMDDKLQGYNYMTVCSADLLITM